MDPIRQVIDTQFVCKDPPAHFFPTVAPILTEYSRATVEKVSAAGPYIYKLGIDDLTYGVHAVVEKMRKSQKP